ncbi:hypothetical protein Esi_0015_0033 [Ectocarpus siliculosus]|uniref:8-amino-7-oxononanoate synthase n=1 Tax=Ectocarpus siliculosus TaxID=2880 RepID=D8LFH1_ECTSI|nr:hypothetical protein Esi_0015_0033 [Ectocarpus siliculosus]|eukprot:CBN79891.1 hypothetical protein Esi_0015_0033 [Ectocarpus siliculosus]
MMIWLEPVSWRHPLKKKKPEKAESFERDSGRKSWARPWQLVQGHEPCCALSAGGCMMDPEGWMRQILARRREEGTLRELRTPEQDRCFVDFTSNDYLGLGRAADLRQAAELEAERARKVVGALIVGRQDIH